MSSEKKAKKTTTTSKRWPVLGSIRKGDNGSYVKFADNVTVLVDGNPLELNKSRTANLQDPRKNVASLVERGVITAEQGEDRLAKMGDWLKYEIVVPPPQQEKTDN